MSEFAGVSRRSLLRKLLGGAAVAGVAGELLPVAARAAGGPKAVVCVYFTDGGDAGNLVVPIEGYPDYQRAREARSRQAVAKASLLRVQSPTTNAIAGLHPALGELAALYQQRALAIVANVLPAVDGNNNGGNDAAVDYARDGFLVPAWAMRAAQGSILDSAGRVFTFSTGLSMTVPTRLSVEGPARDNIALKNAIASADAAGVVFPDSPFGRRMSDALRLIQAGEGMGSQIFMCPMSGTAIPDERSQTAALIDFSRSIAAFCTAAGRLGAMSRVAIYTDAPARASGSQFVIGGAVRGGEIYGGFSSAGINREQVSATVARWAGFNSGAPTLDFL